MFGWFKKAIEWLDGPRLRDTYEDMLLQEAREKAEKKVEIEQEKPTTLVLDTPVVEPAPAPVVEPVKVEPQITDAVTAPVKPKRAKTAKGKFKADDKSTPDVNEAWEGGKAPAKKPAAPKKPRAKKTSK